MVVTLHTQALHTLTQVRAFVLGNAPTSFALTDRLTAYPEWDVLAEANPPTDYPHFMSKKVGTPSVLESYISSRVLLLEWLREVNALLGFTRVEAPEESGDPNERPQMANLSRGKPDWVPANQVHGEGNFIQFDEQALVKWEE